MNVPPMSTPVRHLARIAALLVAGSSGWVGAEGDAIELLLCSAALLASLAGDLLAVPALERALSGDERPLSTSVGDADGTLA
jgi:hypothetical protein